MEFLVTSLSWKTSSVPGLLYHLLIFVTKWWILYLLTGRYFQTISLFVVDPKKSIWFCDRWDWTDHMSVVWPQPHLPLNGGSRPVERPKEWLPQTWIGPLLSNTQSQSVGMWRHPLYWRRTRKRGSGLFLGPYNHFCTRVFLSKGRSEPTAIFTISNSPLLGGKNLHLWTTSI